MAKGRSSRSQSPVVEDYRNIPRNPTTHGAENFDKDSSETKEGGLANMEVDKEENSIKEQEKEYLRILAETSLLPDVFILLLQLRDEEILAKDFDNNAGSIRLKLARMREALRDTEGLGESLSLREERIQKQKDINQRKTSVIDTFKQKIASENEI